MYITICKIDDQVPCMKQDTQSWCSGTTGREGVGGRGFRTETRTPVADSCQRMAKPSQHFNYPPIKIS